MVSIEDRGRMDSGGFSAGQVERKAYVKPMLATHGSVQQLTEGGHKSSPDCGSNVRFHPSPIGGKFFDL